MSLTLSGQLFCSTASTAQPGPDVKADPCFIIVAHTSNLGVVYFGNNGSAGLSSTSGFPLNPGDKIYIGKPVISNLSDCLLLSTSTADGIAWIKCV